MENILARKLIKGQVNIIHQPELIVVKTIKKKHVDQIGIRHIRPDPKMLEKLIKGSTKEDKSK